MFMSADSCTFASIFNSNTTYAGMQEEVERRLRPLLTTGDAVTPEDNLLCHPPSHGHVHSSHELPLAPGELVLLRELSHLGREGGREERVRGGKRGGEGGEGKRREGRERGEEREERVRGDRRSNFLAM